MARIKSRKIMAAATSTGAQSSVEAFSKDRTYQIYGTTSAGSGAAVVKIQGSNDDSNWLDLGQVSLTLSTTASNDGFASNTAWRYIRANVSSISGTNAAVSCTMAEYYEG